MAEKFGIRYINLLVIFTKNKYIIANSINFLTLYYDINKI